MKNILFLSPRLPYPIVGGDKLKAYHTIKSLAAKHKVTLVSFFQGEQKKMPEYKKELEKLGIEVFVLPLNPIKAGFNVFFRLLNNFSFSFLVKNKYLLKNKSLAGNFVNRDFAAKDSGNFNEATDLSATFPTNFSTKNFPLEILYYTQKNFQTLVDNLFAKQKFDVAISFFMRSAEYVKNKEIFKILMCEDCRSLYQKRSAESSKNLLQKIVRKHEYKKLLHYEPEIVNFFNIVTLVTNNDIKVMQEMNNNPHYKLLTNGVDLEKFNYVDRSKRSKNTILFAGKLDVWANELMIQEIVKNIFPIIQQQIPNVNLHIVGANPPKSIKSLAGKNIKIFANVEDILPYFQNSTLFLHPHSGGSGIQNKLLEAMAAGCPVVTTSTGNQGIEAVSGESVLLACDNYELAKSAVSLLLDDNLAEKISKNARKLIENKHSWETVLSVLDEIIEK